MYQDFIRQSKKSAEEQLHKSAITDHETRENHMIDWNQVKVVGHESDRRTRWIKEALAKSQMQRQRINRDTGSYFLPSSYDKLLLCEPAHSHGNDTSRRRVDRQF